MHDEINNYEGRTVEDARMLIENGDTGKWHTDANCLAHLSKSSAKQELSQLAD